MTTKHRAAAQLGRLVPLSRQAETQSLSATINVIVNSDGTDDFDREPTCDDQWDAMTVDERAKYLDDNGPG